MAVVRGRFTNVESTVPEFSVVKIVIQSHFIPLPYLYVNCYTYHDNSTKRVKHRTGNFLTKSPTLFSRNAQSGTQGRCDTAHNHLKRNF